MSSKLVKTPEQIEKMRVSCKLLAQMMDEIDPMVKIGTTPLDIDNFAYEWIKSKGAKTAFLGYGGFPNTLCIGVNDMSTHGIPNSRPFQDGDLVSIDAGLKLDGFFSDMARTYIVGNTSEDKQKFVNTVKQSLDNAISKVKPGNHVGDISHAIYSTVNPLGYHPLVEFVGHGIGEQLHMEPSIPGAYGKPGEGMRLEAGMTLAIETLVNMGGPEVRIMVKPAWNTYTKDGSMFALFEHTVLVIEDGYEVLTIA
jgi:methionyl aminopeptidase